MKHKILLEWNNIEQDSYILVTNEFEEDFYLCYLNDCSVKKLSCFDPVCDYISEAMNEFSSITYIDKNYIRVFKEIIATEKKESNQYSLKVFENALNKYLKDNDLDVKYDSMYREILRNWIEFSEGDYSLIPYFDEIDHIMTLVETCHGEECITNYSGRSWKKVFNQNFRDEVFEHAEDDGWEDLPLTEEQVEFLKQIERDEEIVKELQDGNQSIKRTDNQNK